MSDGILHREFPQGGAIAEFDAQSIGNRALGGIVIIGGEGRIFETGDFFAQGVDARVPGNIIFVITGGQTAKNKGNRDHVLDAVVPVCRVIQGALLIDDPQAGLMGSYGDLFNICGGFTGSCHGDAQAQRCLNRALGMKLGWVGDFE